MQTSELIDLLAKDDLTVRPDRRALPIALFSGLLVALFLIWSMLGIRPLPVLMEPDVLGKLLFTFGLWMLTIPAFLRALRPGARIGWRGFLPLIAAGVVVLGALIEMRLAPGTQVWRFETPFCLVLIPLFALPGLFLIALAAKSEAPTNLTRTGLFAGLVAGGLSASAYALHCPNDDPVYLAAWYLPAVLITGLIGRTLGTRILAW
jgi:hypothetical protein